MDKIYKMYTVYGLIENSNMYPAMLSPTLYMEWLFCERIGKTEIHFFSYFFCVNTSFLIFNKKKNEIFREHR